MADGSYAEFDSSFIRQAPGEEHVNLQRFSHGNPIAPGRYNVDVYINQQWLGRQDVYFAANDTHSSATLCADHTLSQKLDLKPDWDQKLSAALAKHSCVDLAATLPDTTVDFDVATLRLNINIAQLWRNQRAHDYISPQSWDKGVNTAFIGYRFNHYQSRQKNSGQQQNISHLGLNTGINIAGFSLRHSGAYSQSSGQSTSYQPYNTYLQHDIPAWRSQVTVGDFYTDGYLFDSHALRGMQISTDDRMLPASMQGYAPRIRGLAASQALVVIEQNGQTIYTTTVPPGPFEINDLYALSNGGDLTLTITEADGSQHSSTIPYASVSQLLRPGHNRVQLAAGRLRNGNQSLYPGHVLQASWQRGINNFFTLNSGLIAADDYHAGLLGGAINTPIGAFGFDATTAQAKLKANNSTEHGQSYRLHYSRLFDATQTNLTLAAYRYSTAGYYRLSDVASANAEPTTRADAHFGRTKNQIQLSINQYLSPRWGSFYLVGSRKDYWQAIPSETEWQTGYSNHFRRLNYSISASQSQFDGQSGKQRRYMVTMSMPLDVQGRHSINSQISRSEHNTQLMAGLSGSLNPSGTWTYSSSASHGQDNQTAYTVSSAYTGSRAKIQGGYSNNSSSNQISAGISGGVVMHGGGLTLANDLSDTFAIVQAKGATGAKVLAGSNTRIDGRGYAIVPYVSPYRLNTIAINPEGLPLDVQLDATSDHVIPRANSSTMITLSSQPGRTALFDITLADGSKAPMGADIWDEQDRNIGFVAQSGRVFATGLADSGTLYVQWGNQQPQRCRFAYQLPAHSHQVLLPQLKVSCL